MHANMAGIGPNQLGSQVYPPRRRTGPPGLPNTPASQKPVRVTSIPYVRHGGLGNQNAWRSRQHNTSIDSGHSHDSKSPASPDQKSTPDSATTINDGNGHRHFVVSPSPFGRRQLQFDNNVHRAGTGNVGAGAGADVDVDVDVDVDNDMGFPALDADIDPDEYMPVVRVALPPAPNQRGDVFPLEQKEFDNLQNMTVGFKVRRQYTAGALIPFSDAKSLSLVQLEEQWNFISECITENNNAVFARAFLKFASVLVKVSYGYKSGCLTWRTIYHDLTNRDNMVTYINTTVDMNRSQRGSRWIRREFALNASVVLQQCTSNLKHLCGSSKGV